MQTLGVIFLVIVMVALIALIVYVESARRQHRDFIREPPDGEPGPQGQETSLPLKINMGGVIPVIFASSVLALPQTLCSQAFPADPNAPDAVWTKVFKHLCSSSTAGIHTTSSSFLCDDRAVHVLLYHDHVQYGRCCRQFEKVRWIRSGIRPGAPTAEYLNDILDSIDHRRCVVPCVRSIRSAGFAQWISRLPVYHSLERLSITF